MRRIQSSIAGDSGFAGSLKRVFPVASIWSLGPEPSSENLGIEPAPSLEDSHLQISGARPILP
jgi:hypothetical protein